MLESGIDIWLDNELDNTDIEEDGLPGQRRTIKIEGDVKASLAAKPVKYVLRDFQKYLSFGYDMVSDRLTMKYDGRDAEKLRPAKKDLLIY